MIAPRFESLLHEPAAATLVVYRPDGEALASPVWFRTMGDHIEVVIAATDSKVRYLAQDPRCQLLVFETKAPFRGIRVRARAELTLDVESEVRRAIASRYLGQDKGAAYADIATRPPGYVLRLPLSAAKAWDLNATLPGVG